MAAGLGEDAAWQAELSVPSVLTDLWHISRAGASRNGEEALQMQHRACSRRRQEDSPLEEHRKVLVAEL